jgi:drug/metabolite transporter (DMT)-like permease
MNKGHKLLLGNVVVLTIFYLVLDFVFRTYPDLGTFQALAWGYGGSMALTTLLFLPFKKTRRRMVSEWRAHKWLAISVGFVIAIAACLLIYGIKNAGSGPVILLENTQVIFAFLLGVLLLGERMALKEVLSGIVMLVGITLIAGLKGEVSVEAAVACIIAAFFYALQSLLVRKFGKNAHSLHLAHARGTVTFLIVAVIAALTGELRTAPTDAIALLTLAYFFAITVSRYFFFEAHKHLEISRINVFVLLQPVLVLAGAFFIFGDTISLQKFAGAALILIGGFCFVKCHGRA